MFAVYISVCFLYTFLYAFCMFSVCFLYVFCMFSVYIFVCFLFTFLYAFCMPSVCFLYTFLYAFCIHCCISHVYLSYYSQNIQQIYMKVYSPVYYFVFGCVLINCCVSESVCQCGHQQFRVRIIQFEVQLEGLAG